MRLQTMMNLLTLNSDEIRERLVACERRDTELAPVQKRLESNLDTLIAANAAAKDIEAVRLNLAQVTVERESLVRVRSALNLEQLTRQARVKAARYVFELKRTVEALEAERKASQELRFGIRGCGTVVRRWLRARQDVFSRFGKLDALPTAAEQSTWGEMSILFLLRDAFPTVAEIQQATEHDARRQRRLGLSEWGAPHLLHRAITSGEGLQQFYERESPDTLKRIQEALRDSPQVMKILNDLKLVTATPTHAKKPKHTPAHPKLKKPAKRGKRK